MPCSAVTLSLATIAAIVSVALLSIAFSTDNWLTYEVKRNNIQVCVNVFVCSSPLPSTRSSSFIRQRIFHSGFSKLIKTHTQPILQSDMFFSLFSFMLHSEFPRFDYSSNKCSFFFSAH